MDHRAGRQDRDLKLLVSKKKDNEYIEECFFITFFLDWKIFLFFNIQEFPGK